MIGDSVIQQEMKITQRDTVYIYPDGRDVGHEGDGRTGFCIVEMRTVTGDDVNLIDFRSAREYLISSRLQEFIARLIDDSFHFTPYPYALLFEREQEAEV